MKDLNFIVSLSFSDSIEDHEIKRVAQNLLNGICLQANHDELAPVDSEAFTVFVSVTPEGKEELKLIADLS